MRETLYIRWRDPARGPLAYAIAGPEPGMTATVREDAADVVLGLAVGRRLVVFVPAEEVRLTQVEVPTRQSGKVLQAVPFLIEDHLAEDVELLHFALGPRQGRAGYPVAVVSHAEMERWLEPLRSRGLVADAVVPETLCLPLPDPDGTWHLLVEPGQVVVRNGVYSGFSCSPENLPLYLRIADGEESVRRLRVLLSEAGPAAPDVPGHDIELLAGYGHPLQALIGHYHPARTIDLLQGRYSRRENMERLWRPWRLAAGLAVAAFLVALAVNGVWAIRLGHAADTQDDANTQRFHQLFPEQPTSLALSLAIAQEQASLGTPGATPSGLLGLLQRTAQALTASGGLTVQGIQYRDHALYVDLDGSDLQSLDKLRGWFANRRGIRLQVEAANVSGKHAQIRIKVSAS